MGMDVWVAWDIDGTLLRLAADAGHRPVLDFDAIVRASGCPDPRPLPATHGKTDRQILEELVGTDYLDAALTAFHAMWPASFDPTAFEALPGVHATLDHLAGLNGVGASLVTGNIRARAEAKVVAIGVGHHFTWEVSAFGDESAVRADLVRSAIHRSGPASVVVVGDTTRDIAAARAGGAPVVAVATGPESADELIQAGADLVIEDLVAGGEQLIAFVERVRNAG
jgi:phosphoglycolate phosphatase-like HAD superfamily hydrolase